jgi:hypothetical protein
MGQVLVKRGTDANRRGTTFAQGEVAYTTDDKTCFIGDGSTAGGTPACKPPVCGTFYSSTSQNINALASANLVTWNIQSPAIGVLNATSGTTEGLRHSTSTDKHKFTVVDSGVYLLSASLAVDAASSTPTRWNGIMRFRVNDTTNIGGEGKGGYLREASGQDETSLHIPVFAYTFAANDYFWVFVDRESTTSAAVDTTARASTLFCMRVA